MTYSLSQTDTSNADDIVCKGTKETMKNTLRPRTTLPARRSQETRQRILDAAYAVFVRAGYGAASVDEIIAEADISKGALYHHFSGKMAMFQAILADHVRRCAQQMTAAIDPLASIQENVENVLRASWEAVKSDPAWPALQMEFWVQSTRDDTAREVLADSFNQCREVVAGFVAALKNAGVVEGRVDPEAAARLFIAVNDGVLLQWQVQPDEIDPDGLLRPMAQMITRFMTCKDAGS